MGRSILAVVVGVVLAHVVIVGIEIIDWVIYPPPPGFDMHDPAAVRQLMATMPAGAFAMVALGYFLGTVVGAWVAARIARRSPVVCAIVVGGVLLALGVVNLLTIPHPAWFWPVSLAAFPLGTWIGLLIGRRRPATA
jgi:hypothetical protein